MKFNIEYSTDTYCGTKTIDAENLAEAESMAESMCPSHCKLGRWVDILNDYAQPGGISRAATVYLGDFSGADLGSVHLFQ